MRMSSEAIGERDGSGSEVPAEGSVPALVDPLGFELQRPLRHRRRIGEVLDAFAAVSIGDDQVEPISLRQLANLTPKVTALLRIEPDHVASPGVPTR